MMMSQVCICPLEFLNFDFDTFGKEDHYNGEGHKHPNFRCRQLRDALGVVVGVFPIIDVEIA